MKVLFLDIDGVLNRFGDEDGNGRTTKLIDDFFIGLDRRASTNLQGDALTYKRHCRAQLNMAALATNARPFERKRCRILPHDTLSS